MTVQRSALFNPSSQYYTQPGADIDAARVESSKYGSYLANLDQYFAQLDETIREFDLTLGLKQDYFGLEQDKFGLEQDRFDFTKEQTDENSELEWFKAQTSRIGVEDKGQSYDDQIGLGYSELGFKYDELEQNELNIDDLREIAGLTGSTGGPVNFGIPDGQVPLGYHLNSLAKGNSTLPGLWKFYTMP